MSQTPTDAQPLSPFPLADSTPPETLYSVTIHNLFSDEVVVAKHLSFEDAKEKAVAVFQTAVFIEQSKKRTRTEAVSNLTGAGLVDEQYTVRIVPENTDGVRDKAKRFILEPEIRFKFRST